MSEKLIIFQSLLDDEEPPMRGVLNADTGFVDCLCGCNGCFEPEDYEIISMASQMDKNEFEQWIFANYTIDENPMARELLSNVLEYADGMSECEQYNFLCRMIPQVPEQIIRQVSY